MNRSGNPNPSAVQNEKEESSGKEDMLLVAKDATDTKNRSIAENEDSLTKDNLRAEIAMIRAQREIANKAHAKEVKEKEQRIRLLQARIKMLLRDFHKYAAVHRYAAELKDENVPSYIVVLQAKLCREVHHMCVDEAQLKMTRRIAAKMAKFANKQVMDLEQERSELEVKVLNSMAQLEFQHRELKKEYNEKVLEYRRKALDIRKEIGWRHDDPEAGGIDSLMDRLSMINTKSTNPTGPQDELTLDDLKKDHERDSDTSLDEMLASEKSLHNSWSSLTTSEEKSAGGSQRRGNGILMAMTWKSEKIWR